MIHVTRRKLLLVLLSVSLVGFFVYSKIGSKVKILRGTELTSRNGDDIQRSFENGQHSHLSDTVEQRRGEVAEVLRRAQEQMEKAELSKSEDRATETEPLDRGEKKSNEDVGEITRDEGFIIETDREAKTEEVENEADVEGGLDQALPQLPSPADLLANVTDKTVAAAPPVAENIGEDTDARTTAVAAKSPPKRRVDKIGWTRYRAEWRPEANRTVNIVTSKPVAQVITSHYFADNPVEASRAKKLFLKCLSKMSDYERKSFLGWELSYRKRLPLNINPTAIGQRWIALARYMQTLGREQRLPDVINIGAKKSGTTALGWFISMHPQISHAFGNEIHFFDKQYDRGLEYYRTRMDFAKRDQLVFEKTPRYLVTDSAPGHALKDLPPGVKFIICIRDPVKRALSDFRHDSTLQIRRRVKDKVNRNMIAARSPESEGARFAAGAFDRYGNVNSSFDSVRTSSYVKHFKNWLSYFPRDRFLIVDHQRLVEDAFHELHRIEAFLGLTPYFLPSMFYFDLKRQGTCVRGRGNPCPPRSSPGWLPSGKLPPEQEKRLRDYFRPLNREFVELVGDHNFTWVDL